MRLPRSLGPWREQLRRAAMLLGALTLTPAVCTGAPQLEPPGAGGVPTAGTTFAGSQQVLARLADGRLYLAYVKSVEGADQLYVAVSPDQGAT